jgi:hypothetical protein
MIDNRLPHCCRIGGYAKTPHGEVHCGPCWEDLAAEDQYVKEAALADAADEACEAVRPDTGIDDDFEDLYAEDL